MGVLLIPAPAAVIIHVWTSDQLRKVLFDAIAMPKPRSNVLGLVQAQPKVNEGPWTSS